jgi:hypothetical protein
MFFLDLQGRWINNYQKKGLANFGYKLRKKVEILWILLHVGDIGAFFHKKNPFYLS